MVAFFQHRVSVKTRSGIYAKGESWFFENEGAKVARRRLGEVRVGRFDMQGFDADIRDRIVSLVRSILEQNAIASDIAPTAKLVDAGLTSMDMVNLMLGVEAEFDFTIPQDQITPENFQSVETLERLVTSQLRQAAAA
jgi:acyl carrier protein